MDEEIFDVIVIGGGVAGAVAAYQLAQAGKEVVLIERGAEPGSKNLSGGVFYCQVMEEVFPNFVNVAPVERVISRNVISFLNKTSHVNIDYWDQHLTEPVNAVTVLRAKLDAWLVEQCEEAGVMVMPGVRVDSLLMENGACVGVKAGEDELRARIVIAADGVNSFIARDAGLRPQEPMKHLAVGVKSVVKLDRKVLEDRFRLTGNEGVAYAIVGDATQCIAGGAFLYTNQDSVSLGVVMRLDDLAAKGKVSSEVHDYFLAHPAIAPLIEGGELLEYGCHLTIEDGPAMVRNKLTAPGLLLVGDAAGFTLNTGLAIRGMDLAAGSALAAVKAALAALEANDFSQAAMDKYQTELDASFVGKDMKTYKNAPHFLENKRMYESYGPLLSSILFDLFNIDTKPARPAVKVALAAFKRSGLKVLDVVRDAISAAKSL